MDFYNEEAEVYILGCCLLENKAIDTVAEYLIPSNFYRSANRHIFASIHAMRLRNVPVDLITIVDELRREKLIDIVGGSVYVASLTTDTPSSANISYYCKIVRELSQKRKLNDLGNILISKAKDESCDVEEMKTEIEKALLELDNRTSEGYKNIKEYIPEVIRDIEKDYNRKGKIGGVPTGIHELDRLTNGWQESDYIVIGARPSVGKTAAMVQMVINGSLSDKKKIGLFSAEMGAKQIIRRMLSNVGHISQSSMRNGMLVGPDFSSIQDAAGRLYESNIFINDTPNISINELIRESRLMVRKENVSAIFIDYIGLLNYSNKKLQRWEQIGEISRSLKCLARELNIPIIALSQLTRDNEGKRPNMSALRDSGSIEQDADVIMLLHREGESGELEDNLEFILCKQRNGPIGTIHITHKKAYSKMIEKISESN